MKRLLLLIPIIISSLFILPGCEKENNETKTKGPKVETLSAEKGSLCVISLTGRISGLESVALDFECGFEYSTDAYFTKENTTRQKADKKYSEYPYSVSITNAVSGVKYYYRAYYINQLMIYYGAVKDFNFTWSIPKADAVDLGLSVKWATFNVGATKPEDYGFYFAWGEIEPKTDYSWSTYKWCNGSYNMRTKYWNISVFGSNYLTDTLTVLAPEDDVAQVQWGGSWRMPTKAEWDDLRKKCTLTWYGSGNTEFNGVAGYKVTSKIEGYTDRSIFLPAAGWYRDSSLIVDGSYGCYWSSSLGTLTSYHASNFLFNSPEGVFLYDMNRNIGSSVRPVCP
jgi:hypothetical protein